MQLYSVHSCFINALQNANSFRDIINNSCTLTVLKCISLAMTSSSHSSFHCRRLSKIICRLSLEIQITLYVVLHVYFEYEINIYKPTVQWNGATFLHMNITKENILIHHYLTTLIEQN